MTKTNSKQKGARGEREFAKACREEGYEVRRTAQYCGNTGDASDCVGLPGIHIEVKRTERLHLAEALAQALRDSRKSGNIPIVAYRENNAPWKIIMFMSDWFKLYREWELGQRKDDEPNEESTHQD